MTDEVPAPGQSAAGEKAVGSVAVIIPVYNGAKYLGEALVSVLQQTIAPQSVMVIDDGSTDNSVEIARAYPGVQILTQANSGVSASRNRGAALTTAKWIAFLDQDDLWRPDKLQRQLDALERVPGSTVCVNSMSYLNELLPPGSRAGAGATILPSGDAINRLLYKQLRFPPSCVMIDRALLLSVGGFDRTAQPCEDWDLWLRVEQAGARFVVCDEPLTVYRVHQANGSNDSRRMYEGELRAYDRHIGPRVPRWRRWLHRRHARSGFLAGVALVEREQSRPHLGIMLRSIVQFPFGHRRRYSVAVHMLLTRFGVLR